jgi:hypothetical protein
MAVGLSGTLGLMDTIGSYISGARRGVLLSSGGLGLGGSFAVFLVNPTLNILTVPDLLRSGARNLPQHSLL